MNKSRSISRSRSPSIDSTSSKEDEDDHESLLTSPVPEVGNFIDFSQYKVADLEKMIEDEGVLSYDAACVRKKSNWGKTSDVYLFDSENFSAETLRKDMPDYSPKLHALMENITSLDAADKKKHGKTFKHFLFSDLKSSSSGAKLLTSALVAHGMQLGYTAKPKKKSKATDKGYEKIELLPEAKGSSKDTVFLLTSTTVYDQNITVALKKTLLAKFNQRPENIHGELARFIVMDSGFKEGIDLFDIKYIHIFEPSVVPADQKQVVGRGTRTCGQKGLAFHPTKGWPLHVFVYDLSIPEPLQGNLLGAKTTMELYMKAMNLDIRLSHFANELEKVTVLGAVDYDLNKTIHSFSILGDGTGPNTDTENVYGGYGPSYGPKTGGAKRKLVIRKDEPMIIVNNELALVPRRPNHEDMKKQIRQDFSRYTWKDIKMENLCDSEDKTKGGQRSQSMQYTPTQDFIRNYFTPTNPVKGMLLWHGTGTGKTCCAIATTASFEKQGYTILWVTRTTLKQDIWKNMFDQVCNERIADDMEYRGLTIPEEQAKRMKLLSKSWRIRPMSYKQFSNLVAQKNALYKTLVKINGEADPLRKTLLIIDEAHKLYGGADLSSIERPDMDALNRAIANSYEISGQDSVKLLLMTATPITVNPMELVQLVNLCKPIREKMPTDFADFSESYLDDEGKFTKDGRARYLDDIAGYISYLNREKDARQFAQPQIQHIHVPVIRDIEAAKRFDNKLVRSYLNSEIGDLKNQVVEKNKELQTELDEVAVKEFDYLYDVCENFEGDKRAVKQCKQTVKGNIRELVAEAKSLVNNIRSDIKEIRGKIRNRSLFKKEAMAKIRENMDTYEEDYAYYRGSLFSTLKDKCSIKINGQGRLAEQAKQHVAIQKYDEEIRKYNQDIENLQLRLKQNMEIYKQRIVFLKGILKKDLSELERSVIKSTVQDERKKYKKLTKATRKDIAAATTDIRKSIKSVTKKRKVLYNKIKKTVKARVKLERKEEKSVERAEKKLRKTLRKQGDYADKIKDAQLQTLVDKYKDRIDEQLETGLAESAQKVLDMEAKKKEKANARATKKAENEKEKAAKKEARATKKAEKERETAEKKLAKATERKAVKEARKTKKNKEP
jgi:hypothetical protein